MIENKYRDIKVLIASPGDVAQRCLPDSFHDGEENRLL